MTHLEKRCYNSPKPLVIKDVLFNILFKMSDILCHWLNQEVGLSAHCTRENLTVLFKNGYYFGEILYKYGIVTNYSLLNEKKISAFYSKKFFRILTLYF